MEKILANDATNKGLISKKKKPNSAYSSTQKKKNKPPNKKWALGAFLVAQW